MWHTVKRGERLMEPTQNIFENGQGNYMMNI